MSGVGLAPLALIGLGAILSMLLAPRARPEAARAAAAAGMFAALLVTLGRPGGPMPGPLAGDALARFGIALVSFAGLAALAILRPAPPAKEGPALVALATLGAAVLCAADHAATLFLGLELVTLALVGLVALPRSAPALEAAYKLLILGGIGAATLLFGLALGYGATGSLELAAFGTPGRMVGLGAALLLAGLAFKFALAPFHMWTPDLFAGASAAAALVAGVASKTGVALALLRLEAAGPPGPSWRLGLAALGAASVLLGNLQALRQPNLARMLGYSSIAHSGYLALILASGAAIAPEAALFGVAAYAPALIAALAVAALPGAGPDLEELRGLAWRRPLAGAALALALLSLAGLPAAVGFAAKFYLFTALIEARAWTLLAVAALGSALGLYVYLRYVAAICRHDPAGGPATAAPDPAGALLLGLCIAAILGLGVFPAPLIAAVRASLGGV